MDSTSRWVVLGRILRPQGRKGEVLADLLTDFPERFDQHPRVWLAQAGFVEEDPGRAAALASTDRPTAAPQPAEIAAHWLPVGRNAGRIVLRFAGVDSIEQAEKLAGKDVIVPLDERLPLEPGAVYISDLIGCTVYDRDSALGVVEAVQFPTTADGLRRLEEAAPLLTITAPDATEILIPFVSSWLVELNPAARTIRMALPAGLADLNRPSGPDD